MWLNGYNTGRNYIAMREHLAGIDSCEALLGWASYWKPGLVCTVLPDLHHLKD